MAILLNKLPENITEYPNSFERQGAFPLDKYSVFNSLEAAQEYATESPIAYVTQPLGVTSKDEQGNTIVDYYIIGDQAGTLIHVGNSQHNLDEINQRIEDIEKFFQTGEGESLKDTLDQLIELQKWIEEHIGQFSDFQEETEKNFETESKARLAEDTRLAKLIEEETTRANDADAKLYKALEAETERANAEDDKLTALIEAETERANAADQELYQAIEDLTEEDIHLKTDLWTYVDIGKITGASDTSRVKIASAGQSLKEVFNRILGTRQDKQPTITNNASLTATNSKTYSGGEYGTAVAEVTETITFTLSNTGTTNYGYKIGTTEYKGSRTFYYPIVQQENADIKITLPKGEKATVLTKDALVKTDNNILYCNLVNNSIDIQIILSADTVKTEEYTRYGSISATVKLGAPQDANGNAITSFLTYLESEGETAQVTPPDPKDKTGGDKTDSTGEYKINKGYIPYTYCLSTDLPEVLPVTNRTEKLPSSITVSGGDDSTYLYIFIPTGKNDIKTMSASGFAVPFTKASASKDYDVNNGQKATYKVFKTEGTVKGDTFIVG